MGRKSGKNLVVVFTYFQKKRFTSLAAIPLPDLLATLEEWRNKGIVAKETNKQNITFYGLTEDTRNYALHGRSLM